MKRPITILAARLARDRRGVIALFFALAIPVLVAAVAYAVDFTNYRVIESRLQAAADSGALAGVKALDTPGGAADEAVRLAMANVPANWGDVVRDSDVATGLWSVSGGVGSFAAGGAEPNAVRVRAARSPARGNAASWLLFNLWHLHDVSLAAEAIAARQLNIQYEPPQSANLDSDAWDYNEVYVYCHDRGGTGTPESRRTQMTLLSNNLRQNEDIFTMSGGYISEVPAEPLLWPDCREQGQALSFRLRNIRNGKHDGATAFEEGNREEYDYFTDTIISGGVESFSGLDNDILETVRCDSARQCDPSRSGSQVPRGSNRNPNREDRPCLPGKYMYFGWEDRPPESGGSDRDYNDITFLMKCPREGVLGDGYSRLVR